MSAENITVAEATATKITQHVCDNCELITATRPSGDDWKGDIIEGFPNAKKVYNAEPLKGLLVSIGQEFRDLSEIQDLSERLDAGSPVPSGECPACGSLTYLVEPPIDNGELADLIEKAINDGVNECSEEDDGQPVDEAAPIAFIRKVDWEALQSQMIWLSCFQPDDPEGDGEDPEGSLADAEKANGLITLLDALRDAAVKSGIDAKEVFGL